MPRGLFSVNDSTWVFHMQIIQALIELSLWLWIMQVLKNHTYGFFFFLKCKIPWLLNAGLIFWKKYWARQHTIFVTSIFVAFFFLYLLRHGGTMSNKKFCDYLFNYLNIIEKEIFSYVARLKANIWSIITIHSYF